MSARRGPARLLALVAVGTLAATGLTPGAAQAATAAVTAQPIAAQSVAALPVAAQSALPALAAGVISPTGNGCVQTGSSWACDLFAEAGYTTVAGSTQVLTWLFSPTHTVAAKAPVTGTAGTPSFQGSFSPTIVVNQGDTVDLTLHNELTSPTSSALLPGGAAGASLSLTVPGLPGDSGDTLGLAPGTVTKTYHYTASKAGTFLYEAGHTAVGPRAVAMGLVGAIVVRPTGFSATAPTDLVAASTAFDDEQVMVLTDVDPKLAADPLGFDLRNFHSTYRLINGLAFPNTPDIATKAGNRVLLRYANAGVLSHSMGALGLRQNVVAIDGQPSAVGSLVADTLPPGQTEDAIVTAVEGRTAVYDSSGGLDNAGAGVAGDTAQRRISFGGMLQMLSTSPVSPATDTAGPKTTVTAVTGASVTASFTDLASAWCTTTACGPGTVTAAEYVVDQDPSTVSAGGGTPITLPAAALTVTATFTVAPTPALGNGQHRVYLRAMDDANNWGAPVSALITVLSAGPATTGLAVTPSAVTTAPAAGGSFTITATGDGSVNGGGVAAMEYTLTAPGGTASAPVAMAMTPGSIVAGTAAVTLPTNSTAGGWIVSVRSRGVNGAFGSYATVPLTVDNTGPAIAGVTSAAVTPNPTDGTVGDPVDPTALKVQAGFSDTGTVTTPIVAAEGFLTTAGANGSGFPFVANDGTFDGRTGTTAAETAYGLIPLSQLTALNDGTQTVWVHGRDAAGNWGTPVAVPFTLSRAPLIGTVAVTHRSLTTVTLAITGSNTVGPVTAAEWSVGAAAAAAGAGTGCTPLTGTVGPGAVSITCQVTIPVPTGNVIFWARLKNARGWGAASSVTLANAIFADGFGVGAGTTAAWTGAPATATSVKAAPTPPGAMAGAVLVTTAGSANSNVTSPIVTPAAGSYLASLQFRPNTLRTATGEWVTILSLRSGATQVAAVQYQKASTAGNALVRVVATNGTTTSTGLPVTLSGGNVGTVNGVFTIRVAWETSTTANRGVSLYVNSATASSSLTAASTAGQAITGAVLGTVGVTGGAVTGSAYFDGYSANRFTLP